MKKATSQGGVGSLFIFLLLSITTVCCSSQPPSESDWVGVYLRTYGRDADKYEQVELLQNKTYTQEFYIGNQLIFTNSGKWTFVNKNQGESKEWSKGTRLIIFDNWLSADELLRVQSLGYARAPLDIKKDTYSAIIYRHQTFAFDVDGGSDYEKQ